MTGNTRNLLLFSILASAALATWIMARITTDEFVSAPEAAPETGGYYMLKATVNVTGDDGGLLYRILADRVVQEADTDGIVFDEMRVEYTPEAGVLWNIYAAHGLADPENEELELLEDVRLSYIGDAAESELTFEMDELRLYANEFLATTELPVVARRDDANLFATGLNLNLQTDEWELASDVSIRARP